MTHWRLRADAEGVIELALIHRATEPSPALVADVEDGWDRMLADVGRRRIGPYRWSPPEWYLHAYRSPVTVRTELLR